VVKKSREDVKKQKADAITTIQALARGRKSRKQIKKVIKIKLRKEEKLEKRKRKLGIGMSEAELFSLDVIGPNQLRDIGFARNGKGLLPLGQPRTRAVNKMSKKELVAAILESNELFDISFV